MDQTANKTYEARAKKDLIYRIRTWFHRLFDFRPHYKKIDAEVQKIEIESFRFNKSFYEAKIKKCLANRDPKNAEEALSNLFLHPDRKADILKKIMELYFEKGDSASLLGAFRVISDISVTLAGGPNQDTFDRVGPSMKVFNGLLEKDNEEDLLIVSNLLNKFGWRNVSPEVRIDITTKVVERLIQMAEEGNLSGLDLGSKISLYSNNWENFQQIIQSFKNKQSSGV